MLGLDTFVVLVVVVVAGLAGLAVRRRVLQRMGGTFDCSLRLAPRPHGKGWMLGIARYTGDVIEWYRVFSFSPRPKRVLTRGDILVRDRRRPEGPETYSLLSGSVVVACTVAGAALEFAMGDGALTGFLSWLEAAPPGQHVRG